MPLVHSARRLAGVPVLLVHPEPTDAPPPAVLWFHGFRSDAAANAAELERIARAGFLAVGVDAVGHGARRDPNDPLLDAAMERHPRGALGVMLDLAAPTAAELPALVRTLGEQRLADPARVSAVGVSMGGYLAYRAPLAEPSLRAVIAMLGSPEWPGDDSPHRRLHDFRALPLLSVTAECDVNVPPDAARRFHAALAERYPEAPARHAELPGAEHLMRAEQWDAMIGMMLDWLGRHGR